MQGNTDVGMVKRKQSDIKKAAQKFVAEWKNRGKEDKDYVEFWEDLLEDVFGVPKARKEIEPQSKVKFEGTTKRIDIRVKTSKVVIEQKSNDVDLDTKQKQSGKDENGNEIWLKPIDQAIRYYNNLDHPDQGRYVIACNFKEFEVWDSYHKNSPHRRIQLEELPTRWRELKFLVEPYRPEGYVDEKREERVSSTASEYIQNLYDTIYDGKKEWTKPELQSLNMFCVRVVFCLFAEDAGIFDDGQFSTFLDKFSATDLSKKFDALFFWLDMTDARRREYYKLADVEVQNFPYVDGGLFNNTDLYETPTLSQAACDILKSAWNLKLKGTDETFDWSEISPTNFGCIFESTVDSDVRESGGMHYTTPSNIHRVIDPLFLDDLKTELERIVRLPIGSAGEKDRKYRELENYRNRLADMRFLDPACGSGNFLTECYKSLYDLELRAIENELEFRHDVIMPNTDPCKVRMGQFYGIEIDHFAASVARASLWIAGCQLIQQTAKVLHCAIDPLPLDKNNYVVHGDALETDWETVLKPSKNHPTYIIGNPPFKGARGGNDSKEEKERKKAKMQSVMNEVNAKGKPVWANVGDMDFVCAWYAKAARYMQGRPFVKAAFVSTNSVVQGEQAVILWKPLMEHYKLRISFAWRTFKWFNEAKRVAQVHCVIVGFYCGRKKEEPCRIFEEGKPDVICEQISNYLLPSETFFIHPLMAKPLCNVPKIGMGNQPIDDGNYLFTKQQMQDFIAVEPLSKDYFHEYYGSEEFSNGVPRYCLWLGDCEPDVLSRMPHAMKRVEAVRQYRLKSTRRQTRELADKPRRFATENMPVSDYLVIPETSSSRRCYVPFGYMSPDIFCSNAVRLMLNATPYHFGVLESRIHMAWLRVVCGRMKSDYRYSIEIVYNNFPWPQNLTEEQKSRITTTAQAILDARMNHPTSTLKQLYDPSLMPSDLVDAHRKNDRAVIAAYSYLGITPDMSDEEIALVLLRESVRLAAPKPQKRKKAKSRTSKKF